MIKQVLSAIAVSLALRAQAPQRTTTAEWEVVSIRPCEPQPEQEGRRGGGVGVSPGRLHITCVSANFMIQAAYVIFQGKLFGSVPVSGGPAWIKNDRWNIEAKAVGAPSGQMMQGPMLQALLEERFKLKLHHETKEIPVYELSIAKGGFKLQPLAEGACVPFDATAPVDLSKPIGDTLAKSCGLRLLNKVEGRWVFELRGMTLDEIAEHLRSVVDRPVVNKTGLAGLFNFRLEFAPDEVSAGGIRGDGTTGPALPIPDEPTGGPSIFTAIQEQAGLKLEGARGPGDSIVIDAAERPEEN